MANKYEELQLELQDTANVVKEVSQGKRIGYYKLRGLLGRGGFSEVKLGIHCLLEEKVAVKIMDKGKLGGPASLKMVKREMAIMERLSHPNIVTLFEMIETLDKFYCIMEYIGGGPLDSYITRKRVNGKSIITEDEARFFFIQILDAVTHMHFKGIYHRDLKNENILLIEEDKTIRVADFGISSQCSEDELLEEYSGTPPCMPPEVHQHVPYRAAAMDVWTLGVLLYHLVDGNFPFNGHNAKEVKTAIVALDYYMPPEFSTDLQNLLRDILVANPDKRISMEGIWTHPWMKGVDDRCQRDPYRSHNNVVKEKLLKLGVPEEEVVDVIEHGANRSPKDSFTGTFRILVQQLESEQVGKAANARGPRFSIAPRQYEEPEEEVPEKIILEKTESELRREKCCCTIL